MARLIFRRTTYTIVINGRFNFQAKLSKPLQSQIKYSQNSTQLTPTSDFIIKISAICIVLTSNQIQSKGLWRSITTVGTD